MKTESGSDNSRLHHLDALRSMAILYGVLVHTATLGVEWPLDIIGKISIYFRMGTFFLISGLFSSMLLLKLGNTEFLKKRALSLLVPFFVGVIFLNPVANWLVWNWNNPPMSFADYVVRAVDGSLPAGNGLMIWHLHLWFLLSLSFYALTAPLVVDGSRRFARVVGRFADGVSALPGWASVIVIAGICALCSLSFRIFYELLLERPLETLGLGIAGLVRNTLYYWPMFLTGMAVHAHRRLLARFQVFSVPALAIGAAILTIQYQFIPLREGILWEVVDLVGRSFLTVSVVAALMALFSKLFSSPSFLSRSSDSIYSIYILHYLAIYLIAHALRGLALPNQILFWIVSALTIGAVFAIHRFLIKPSAFLSLVFNGKPLPEMHRREARL